MTDYLYAYVKCGRKAWHLGKLFSEWEEVDFDRGDFVEHHTFRLLPEKASADDRQLARDYAEPFRHPAE